MPAGCLDCGLDLLLWRNGKPAGPLRDRENGRCHYHNSVAMQQDGGLPVASAPRPLDVLMTRWDREAEVAWARWRGLSDRLDFETVMQLENRAEP